jgi:hypothetical protein
MEHVALRLVGRLALAFGIALATYLLVYRPLQLRWGATAEEVTRAMPGDEIQPHPVFDATRAVTIDARPDEVWPWLVQIGYQRAGWYGYDLLDNAGVPSSRQIIPELQSLKVGDILPIFTIAYHRVVAIEPGRYLLTRGDESTSWIFALYPVDEAHTRLVWRIRNAPYQWTSWFIGPQLLSDAIDLIAVRDNMLGIKERAEGRLPANPEMAYVELALWLVAFLGYVVVNVGVVFWRDWRRAALVAVGAALVTIAVVLVRPPIGVDGLAAVAIWIGAWWACQPARIAVSRFARSAE